MSEESVRKCPFHFVILHRRWRTCSPMHLCFVRFRDPSCVRMTAGNGKKIYVIGIPPMILVHPPIPNILVQNGSIMTDNQLFVLNSSEMFPASR
ncbi:hypothetical protein [Sphingobacterium mizutaii]|uniref:hypothetical protein n=1 Tax=Sphingobacterium mizutaii TaxID=1010 RepID=UPI0015873BB8|nr:hypothetical protein [Sphingobacterium mizutaii]